MLNLTFFKQPKVHDQIAISLRRWDSEICVFNEDIKSIVKVCLNWIVNHGEFEPYLFYDFINTYLPNHNTHTDILLWVRFNLEILIMLFSKRQHIKINTPLLRDLWLKTETSIDINGYKKTWHPFRVNYQVAIYAQSPILNEIALEQFHLFLNSIGYKPLRYILIQSNQHSLCNFEKKISARTCPFRTITIHHNPDEIIAINDRFSRIPCVVFGGHNLKFSSNNDFKCYPSYQDISEILSDLKLNIQGYIKSEMDENTNENCTIN